MFTASVIKVVRHQATRNNIPEDSQFHTCRRVKPEISLLPMFLRLEKKFETPPKNFKFKIKNFNDDSSIIHPL
jgi:hypothetical protein